MKLAENFHAYALYSYPPLVPILMLASFSYITEQPMISWYDLKGFSHVKCKNVWYFPLWICVSEILVICVNVSPSQCAACVCVCVCPSILCVHTCENIWVCLSIPWDQSGDCVHVCVCVNVGMYVCSCVMCVCVCVLFLELLMTKEW